MVHPIGKTQSVSYEIGFRRAFHVSIQKAWEVLTSQPGVKIWLGETHDLQWQRGAHYTTADGATGEVRVVNPEVNLRITWQPRDWEKPSTIQIRTLAQGDKTVISFHQEHLAGERERILMHNRWQSALYELAKLF